jgi:copper transport protein
MRRTVMFVLTILGVGLAGIAPAGAHTRVVATSPADGAVVGRPPSRVVMHFDNKQVTAEGDPIRVYGPGGQRVDRGGAAVEDGATTLTVGLGSGPLPRGEYQVAYRVVSRDTHLVTGLFTFRSRGDGPSTLGAGETLSAGPSGWAHSCSGCDHRPDLLVVAAGGGLVVATIWLAASRWRDRREPPGSGSGEPPAGTTRPRSR